MPDRVFVYLGTNTFRGALTSEIEHYEGCTAIDPFFNHAPNGPYFYERTVEGMVYWILRDYISGGGGHMNDLYLLLLETPYTANNAQTISDLMWINLEGAPHPNQGTIGAIEIKTDFLAGSVMADLNKLVAELAAGTIAKGVMIYLAPDQHSIGQITTQYRQVLAIRAQEQAGNLLVVGVVAERD